MNYFFEDNWHSCTIQEVPVLVTKFKGNSSGLLRRTRAARSKTSRLFLQDLSVRLAKTNEL